MAKKDQLVLVSGATGQQGGAIAHELLDAGWAVRIMTRKPEGEKARALAAKGAEVVQADLDDEGSLSEALKGAWGAVGIQNTWEAGVEKEEVQGKRFARVAKQAGVQHLLYQSVASAQRATGIPHFDNKWRIEETIRALKFPSYVIVRPVFFMENFLGAGLKEAIDNGTVALAIKPETKLQMVTVHDVGKYGLAAFERAAELNGRAIDIASDELTGPEMAVALTTALGRPFNFHEVPIEQIRAFSEEYAVMLEWFDAVGYDVDIAGNAREFGIEPTRFGEWAKDTIEAPVRA
jgi:uncharacterized protein YbjT (DUF2867 family)